MFKKLKRSKIWTQSWPKIFVLGKGTTFIFGGHIWFNLTEPHKNNSYVLCVNLTTLDEDCPDDECLIDSDEYAWVEEGHPTAVAFSRARLLDAKKIISSLENGFLKKPREGNISKSTLTKILKAAYNSRELSGDLKKFL